MAQQLHFDQLNLNDNENDFVDDDQDLQTTRDDTENTTKPEELDRDDATNDDFERVFENQLSNDSNNDYHDGIRLTTNSDQSSDDASNSEDATETDGEDLMHNDRRFPTCHPNVRHVNEWSQSNINERVLYIRYQTRIIERGCRIKCKTSARRLFDEQFFICDEGKGEKLYFHTTDCSAADSIGKKGPKLSKNSKDLVGPDGAFYLNPEYKDCYRFGQLKRDPCQDEHAMLIYKFNPSRLSENGKTLTEEEWKDLVCGNNTPENDYDWVIGPMNANPSRCYEPGQDIPVCRTPSGRKPMQLVIRSQRMCRKLLDHLVGVIFYEKVHFSHEASNRKRHRSSTVSKTRRSKRSRGK